MPWILSHRFNADDALVGALMTTTPHEPDDYRVKTRNVLVTEDGHVFTLTEPPSVHALLSSMKAIGVDIEESETHTIWHCSLATS